MIINKKTYTFIILNFIISACSDIFLRITNLVPQLKPYFQENNIFISSIYAGFTIIIPLIFLLFISHIFLPFTIPNTINELLIFCILAFILGYFVDFAIFKYKIFGNTLNKYYKKFGYGILGAMAFLFSIIISFIIMKFLF
jgi:hypothetical protein